ncbi:uncharacterized protein BP5553_07724 [Venustampulla echinocandica]|uniref:Uncharacterized protein n=1 Tax=Venustampulla echinocandica TaxID=2656787 RepID=A0A370THC4_9HELO|nr:uncharacterized protein BP5553_07724 [Venustampulla echinocandica]RDL34596.1 hypothetical protein BP5553_07724 [Venustampulla echinocandica]
MRIPSRRGAYSYVLRSTEGTSQWATSRRYALLGPWARGEQYPPYYDVRAGLHVETENGLAARGQGARLFGVGSLESGVAWFTVTE